MTTTSETDQSTTNPNPNPESQAEQHNSPSPPATKPAKLVLPLLLIFISVFVLMTAYEAIKAFLAPDMSLWESHVITIIFSSIIAVVAAWFVLSRLSSAHDMALDEIEERSQAAQKFSRTEYFLGKAQQIARLGYYIFDITAGTWTSSALLDEIFGIDKEFHRDVPSWLAIIHPEQQDEMFEYLQIHILTEHQPFDREYRIINQASGETCWVHGLGELEFNDEGVLIRMIGTIQDITRRKQADAALRESEERYRFLFENASDAIFIVQDEKVKFPNPKTLDLLGFSEEELTAAPFFARIHPLDQKLVLDRHHMRLDGEQPPATYEFRVLNKDEEEVWVQLNTALITWEGKPGTLNFLRDITQQKQLESQLHQAQKMEAIGTLAGGVAHDFNNILTSIAGHISLMELKSDLSQENIEKLQLIQQQIHRATDLTAQLLGFARGGKYEVKPLDLNKLLKDTSEMFGRTRREISISRKYQEGLWTVEADKNQIEQVLLNCFVNAWKAMPEGGDLYLSTQNVILNEDYTQQYKFQPGRYVKISITDTGVGMDEQTRLKVFDPFFTTREMGHGTGLGMASAYGIVKNHSGIINIYSEEGQGSTFNIYLPASDKEVNEEIKPETTARLGTETILLVDDEPVVVEVASELLKQLGYTLLVANNGKEALKIYEETRDSIDLVILDMIMPEFGGGQTFDKLKEINPDVKVLLASGYSLNGQAMDILNRGCDGFIQKPFDLNSISAKVREVLDKD